MSAQQQLREALTEALRRCDIPTDAVPLVLERPRDPQHGDVSTPLAMSLAKALTSAYQPLSAVIVPEKVYQAIVEASAEVGNFAHGYTFSGHPVAAAVALNVLEIYEREDIFSKVAALSPRF